MHLKSGNVLLRKGGMVTSISNPLKLLESKEDFIKKNKIVGKLMKQVLQSSLSQQSPSIMGGDKWIGEVNNITTKVAFDPSAGYGASGYLQNQGQLNRMINSTSDDVAMETTENLPQVIAGGKNY